MIISKLLSQERFDLSLGLSSKESGREQCLLVGLYLVETKVEFHLYNLFIELGSLPIIQVRFRDLHGRRS
jgi:hypothetical protein